MDSPKSLRENAVVTRPSFDCKKASGVEKSLRVEYGDKSDVFIKNENSKTYSAHFGREILMEKDSISLTWKLSQPSLTCILSKLPPTR